MGLAINCDTRNSGKLKKLFLEKKKIGKKICTFGS
jgi:hypothetical protein